MSANKQNYYQIPVDEVIKSLNSNLEGLTAQEAFSRQQLYGFNRLEKLEQESHLVRFLRQFKDLMIVLLVVSAFISLYLNDLKTSLILLTIVLINASIGFVQEFKAEKVMQSLRALQVAEAKVFRSGLQTTVDAKNLVAGDIIYIEEGDSIPADGRIIEENELSTNDFALTGESNPSRKFTHAIKGESLIGNRRNLVFMGTTVATGNAKVIVTEIGMGTELGRIASLSQEAKTGLSPLQREMNNLASRITVATLILAAILTAVSLEANLGIKESFLFAIGVAAAMIPQGLPAELNASLAQAANRLAKAKALVKKLSAVETLGATSIICTDKTGTLTKNEMTVEQIGLLNASYSVSGTGYESSGGIHHDNGTMLTSKEIADMRLFFVTGHFASNAKIRPPDELHQTWYCLGDPTEGALVTLAQKAGFNTESLDSNSPELKEFPFDSARKRMSSVRLYEDKLTVFVKGSVESVLERCSHIRVNNKVRPITKADKILIKKQNDLHAKKALRNLAYAYRYLPKNLDYKIHNPDVVENNLVYLGMVSMLDPVREEVPEAMLAARRAHIRVSIITGDYATTAKAIATKARLATSAENIDVISGEELPKMKDSLILSYINKGGVVFSRVSPQDKLRIVDLARKNDQVIAVTGDGINDAPALKRASIGVAMGKVGTDVAKQSSEIILLDDSFHTLVGAIQQGRGVFQNIKKATLSCLTSNFGELATVLIGLVAASIFGIPPAILAVQILAVDLIAELLPIAALGWDNPEKSLMKEKPRDIKQHIFNRITLLDLIATGVLIGVLSYANFLLFAGRNGIELASFKAHPGLYASATTLTYVTIVFCQLINIFIRRTEKGTVSKYLFSNKKLLLAVGFSVFCVVNIVYNPLVQKVFSTSVLEPLDWLFVLAAGAVFFVIRETIKVININK
ncbi:cation-transporting P-type ATPase [Candidatus Saccharibacteria bacterium]|nr:cation-transporting P-type ATPase [Candidatus Saccharibacteria bacterium]